MAYHIALFTTTLNDLELLYRSFTHCKPFSFFSYSCEAADKDFLMVQHL